MTQRLEGKRIVVTGGAQGLGLACATRFVADGAKVVIADINVVAGQAAEKSFAQSGGAVIFRECDVTRREDIAGAIELCETQWGGIDVLVNNAGVALKGNILTLDPETLDRVLAVNLKSAFHGTQLAAQSMIKRKAPGVIINMSSVNAVLNIPDLLAYNMSKGALNQLTKNTAISLAPHGIRVCGIGPGTIMTELARKAVWSDPATRKSVLSRTPIGRPGEPEEIASIASFLASDDASYITGETIYADGGRLGLNYTVATE